MNVLTRGQHVPLFTAIIVFATVGVGYAQVPKAEDMVRLLVEGQEAVVRTARSVFRIAEKAGDEATADLLTQRIQLHEKTAWMLRSLLEK